MTGNRPAVPFLRVSEIFGPTLQGEGPATGRRAVFLRLAGCPVGCSWCDTRYSWDPRDPSAAGTAMGTGQAADRIDGLADAGDIVVVTGGEPLAQQPALLDLLARPQIARRRVHLETAGVHRPDPRLLDAFDTVVVSPKLANAGVPAERRRNDAALGEFAAAANVWFKFVVRAPSDLAEIAGIASAHGMRNVTVMAEGTDAETVLRISRDIADEVIGRGWSLTPRWHILLWGDQPGR